MDTVIPDDYPPVYPDHPEQLDRLRTIGMATCYNTRAESESELIGRLKGASFVINVRAYSKFTPSLLESLPELRVISVLGTGTDNIDISACTAGGIVVTNCPTASTISVAELSLGLILAVARKIALMDRNMRAGQWMHEPSVELHGKVLGVIGLGQIGQHVARLGVAFGMRVLAWSFRDDPERSRQLGVESVPLDRLLQESDVVTLHLRNSPQAQGLLGAEKLSLMRPSAILINTARAAIVDEEALLAALKNGRLAGAGIDVYLQEPLGADSPWTTLDNVVLTPHVGAATTEAQRNLAATPVDNILNFLDGNPTNVVNSDALAHPRHSAR